MNMPSSFSDYSYVQKPSNTCRVEQTLREKVLFWRWCFVCQTFPCLCPCKSAPGFQNHLCWTLRAALGVLLYQFHTACSMRQGVFHSNSIYMNFKVYFMATVYIYMNFKVYFTATVYIHELQGVLHSSYIYMCVCVWTFTADQKSVIVLPFSLSSQTRWVKWWHTNIQNMVPNMLQHVTSTLLSR